MIYGISYPFFLHRFKTNSLLTIVFQFHTLEEFDVEPKHRPLQGWISTKLIDYVYEDLPVIIFLIGEHGKTFPCIV